MRHVVIPGIEGIITGRVRLFDNEISGGKSVERGASNGFHVNVLGRAINQGGAYFGEKKFEPCRMGAIQDDRASGRVE